jgi:hypothetical protein
MGFVKQTAMLFPRHVGMGFQLRLQMGPQHSSFHRRPSGNRFGQDMPHFSSGFEVTFDGRDGDAERLGNHRLALSSIDGVQYSLA